MKDSIYWLKAIHDILSKLVNAQVSSQADWDEEDETSPSYIKNKPEIPVPPQVAVIEGAVADNEFTPTEADYADALAIIAEDHGMVYLKYEDDSEDVYELVVGASASQMVTAGGVTWEAPDESDDSDDSDDPDDSNNG